MPSFCFSFEFQPCFPCQFLFHASAGGREPWDLARFGRTVAFFNEDMSTPGRALQTVLTAPFRALVQLVAGSGSTVRLLLQACRAPKQPHGNNEAVCATAVGIVSSTRQQQGFDGLGVESSQGWL